MLEKQREFRIQYEHALLIKERECKAFDEAFRGWNLADEKNDRVTGTYESAKEKLADAIAGSTKRKKELEKLESDWEHEEWKEDEKVARELKKMRDAEQGKGSTTKC